MLLPRVLPCLLLRDRSLVKTIRFENPTYVGDPINAVNIFNEKGVDEIVLLDIEATKTQRPPNFLLLEEIATECFIPLTYGGGVRSLDDMELLYGLGIEKISFNTALVERPDLVRAAATQFGSQSVVASIDVRRGRKGVRVRRSIRNHANRPRATSSGGVGRAVGCRGDSPHLG